MKIFDRLDKTRFEITLNKLLKGAGAGANPTEIDVPAAAGPTIVLKTSDETVNNSAALQDDDELFFAAAANEIWLVEANILLYRDAAAAKKTIFAWSLPAGATAKHRGENIVDSIPTHREQHLHTSPLDLPGSSDGGYHVIIRALVVMGGTAGNIQLRWAQQIAEAFDHKVLTNSCIIALKLA